MKIRLIVATNDEVYAEKFYIGAMQLREDVEISICTDYHKLSTILDASYCDVCLVESDGVEFVDRDKVKLTLLLWDERRQQNVFLPELKQVNKYQRISSVLSQVIGLYAEVAPGSAMEGKCGRITVVWSPAGGVGKTSVALARAVGTAADGKQARYLDLEYFSASPVLFRDPGNSLSAVFEQMVGNMALRLQGLQNIDRSTGVSYFGQPSNYDDMNALNREETVSLIEAAGEGMDELVIDLPGVCDQKTLAVFEMADQIILVMDASSTAQCKLQQFMTQNSVYRRFANKMLLVANKGAMLSPVPGLAMVRLPYIRSTDPIAVYSKLAANRF